jgi:hypothetical protein
LQYQGRIRLILELSPFLCRERPGIGPGHSARIYFHGLQLAHLVLMEVMLVVPFETILELFF